jgi:hypothetical protein
MVQKASAKLGDTISCVDCGRAIEKTSPRKKLCQACAKARKAAQDLAYASTRRAAIAEKSRRWYAENTERANARAKAYRDLNAESLRAKDNASYADNPEPSKRRAKNWYAKNRETVLARMRSEDGRKKSREGMAKRLASDPSFKLHSNFSRAVRASISDKKNRKWEDILGYSTEALVLHLERQFLPGMTWDNHGKGHGKWHIDHILPQAMFSFRTSECPDFKFCWALTNLRPLWSRDNISKHANRTLLI